MRPPSNYHASRTHGEARQVRSLQASPAPQSQQAPGPLVARQPANTNPYRDMSHPPRPRLTPGSRRASDQDVVLPSVEQPEHLSQKRKSIPSSLYRDDSSLTFDAYRDPTAKRMRPAYNAMPEVVDLTSSPSRPVYHAGRDAYPAAGQRPHARGYEYVPVSPRGAPPGDARGPYREVVVLSSPRGQRPAYDGSYEQRGAFALDGASMNEPARRYAPPAPLYMQNGYQQGHYPTH